MYKTKFVIILGFLGIVCSNEEFRRIDSIQQESACTAQGGLCTIAADCPNGHLMEERGLCPQQQKIGVECCYGSSVKETRCKKRGGECFPKNDACNERLVFKEATDCPKDKTCCILVN